MKLSSNIYVELTDSISSLAANTYTYMGEFHSDQTRAKQLSYAGVFIAIALTFCPGLTLKKNFF